jgi:beta-fructofuranosidase
MYVEFDGNRKTIGDVDIVYHDGCYHLFHLVLPNHDYIAHAVSRDGLHWIRVENAIFIGHPGSWDDSMLWTMHISPDPHRPNGWRMFYTGISRCDRGLKQRIGLATSDDLYRWQKHPVSWRHNENSRSTGNYNSSLISALLDPSSCYPLAPTPKYYEAGICEGRQWVSWRDPFYFRDNGQGWLLCSGRVNEGPVVRRGCVAAMEEVEENRFVNRPPLYHPGLYDDIEVPNLLKIDQEYYLIGSIREDAKIRYWHTQSIGAPWKSYHDNVLLGEGNYAGRVCADPGGWLIWSFFTRDRALRDVANMLPPPKRLARMPSGLLRAQSFEKILDSVIESMDTTTMRPLNRSWSEDHYHAAGASHTKLSGCSGFQAFLFDSELASFRMQASMKLCGSGKCGIVFRMDRQTHDGYYLSLDLMKGIAQMRDWGTNSAATGDQMMRFESLQSGFWRSQEQGMASIQLIAFGSYLELSIDERVVLCLVNDRYESGAVGFYVESAELELRDICLQRLTPPSQSDEHLAVG